MALGTFPQVKKLVIYADRRQFYIIAISVIHLISLVSCSLHFKSDRRSYLHSIPNNFIYIGGIIDIPLIAGVSAAAVAVLAALLYFFIKMKKNTVNLEKVRAEAVELDRREMVHGEIEAQAQVVELATIEANESNNIIILPPSCIILNV